MLDIYPELLRVLTAGEKSVLVRIVRKLGSAPRTVGAPLLLKADGSFVGSVGGGRLEHDVLGMIGSRRKRDMIYASLVQEGVAAEELQQVRCPIGISIGAQTPEEIAVSIVAELIQVRAQAQADRRPPTETLR